ncbi:MAG: DNA-binding protein [Mesorhizobium sp.]|uniref:helix-turn-helix domain-containing protein n=1 Tax=Mesorhizobium sp. TaxID=1871066 RepID=UPI000FE9B510|nr:MAG: DNA-binding protein [Mesorhizobium sp.]
MQAGHKSSRKSFLTIPDVADLLQLSEKTIRRLIATDQLPAHRLGRQWRISPGDLESFMSSRRRGRSTYDL